MLNITRRYGTLSISLLHISTIANIECLFWHRGRGNIGERTDPTPFHDISWPELFEHDVLKNCVGESFFKWSVLFFTNGTDSIRILYVKLIKVYVQVEYTEFVLFTFLRSNLIIHNSIISGCRIGVFFRS